MSYEIVYDRQFIKLQLPSCDIPWILPLSLHGSNNCTELMYNGRERRVRDWSGLFFNSRNQIPLEAPSSLMEKVETFCGTEYQEHFKRNGKWVDDAGLIRYFKNGIKESKSLEELNEMSHSKVVLNCYLSVWSNGVNNRELDMIASSSAELLQFILAAKLRIRNRLGNEEIYVCIGFTGDKALPNPKNISKVKKQPKNFETEYWVLRSIKHNNVYVSQLTARQLRYTYHKTGARKFASEKEAVKWVESKIKGKFSGVAETLIPERVEVGN